MIFAASVVCAGLLVSPGQPQEALEEIRSTLLKATNKSGYEDGGYEAAQRLADLRSAEAMELRIDLFDQRMDTFRGVYLRDWFYSGMQKAQSIDENSLLAEAAADKKNSPLLRKLSLRSLAFGEGRVPIKPMISRGLTKEKDSDLRKEWLLTLGTLEEKNRLDKGKRWSTQQQAALEKLLLQEPGFGLLNKQALSDNEWGLLLNQIASAPARDRSTLLDGLRGRTDQPPSWTHGVESALRGPDWGPRALALQIVQEQRLVTLTPTLISLLREEHENRGGRYAADLGAALMNLTGLRIGSLPSTWENWWEKAGPSWLDEGGELPPGQTGRPNPQDDTIAKLFGIPVDSKRIVVLVDGSGSMQQAMGTSTRAETAAHEFSKFLERLPDDAMIDLVVVENTLSSAFGKLVSNKKRNRAEAVDHLRRREFSSGSALLNVCKEVQLEWGADTLVLIGDGGSSSGTHQYVGHLLDEFQRLHIETGIKIHTVAIGAKGSRLRFLRDLAKLSGGTMVEPEG